MKNSGSFWHCLKMVLANRFFCLQWFSRNSTFFSKTAHEIWKTTVSVSNPGAKKGRGRRGSIRSKNLNIGQDIGVGKFKVNLPGLNVPFDNNQKRIQITEHGSNDDYQRNIDETRSKFFRPRRASLPKSERGWTGGQIGGRSLGKVNEIDGFNATDFDTRVLFYSHRMVMTSTYGKQRRVRALVACGNGNGLIGLGAHLGINSKITLDKAKQRACRNLVYVNFDRFDSTVLHNFKSEFGYANLFVTRRGEGHGLECHRMLRSMCELIGIRNLYAKSDGSANIISIANAFLLGLIRQKSYQQWADETNMLVVSIDDRANGHTDILASPSNGYVRSEVKEDEDFNFERMCMGGLTRYDMPWKSSRTPWYFRTSGYLDVYLKRKVHPIKAFRRNIIDTLTTYKDIDDSCWRYPMFNPNADQAKTNK
ncbi:hypothetical protein GJ496_007187 [Pomphorhynchus laevis]|nr:hypothetical protein GJ496_007187 [Pomphorhynchus laevis]